MDYLSANLPKLTLVSLDERDKHRFIAGALFENTTPAIPSPRPAQGPEKAAGSDYGAAIPAAPSTGGTRSRPSVVPGCPASVARGQQIWLSLIHISPA